MPFNIPGLGQSLTQPQLPAQGVAPTDPSQVGLWQRFQQRLKDDPNLRMALLTTGLNLLKTPQRGESGFDVFSNAALTGVGTLDQLRRRKIEDQKAQTEEARRAKELQLAERRTAATEERVTQSAKQFDENLRLSREQFKESKRQFDEKLKSVEGRYSALTGAERMANAGVEALVTALPNVYPDTPEGRAKARLRVQGLDNINDPLAQARIMAGLYGDLQDNNVFLDEDKQLDNAELRRQTAELFQFISSDLSKLAGETEENADPLEGTRIKHFVYGGGTVQAVGDGKYVIRYDSGSKSSKLTAEQIMQVQGTASGNP